MRWKQEIGDFRVEELLEEGFLKPRGPVRVYRVTKTKLTTLEAVEILAGLAGVPTSEVHMAGLKDRQGITTQYLSIRGGKPVDVTEEGFSARLAACADEHVSSEHSRGNAFRVRLRAVQPTELASLRSALGEVRRHGLVNYFDEQRFGNLTHGQGWIAKGLARGHVEAALRRLLTARSDHDDPREAAFKDAVDRDWGDWAMCRDHAGRRGKHHSLFEHLRDNPQDFVGAFQNVSTRIRLIHLYAFQSHLWNRAVASYIADLVGRNELRLADGIEGPLVFHVGELPVDLREATFRLPGTALEDVTAPEQRRHFEEVLAQHGLVADDMRIEIPGFQLKGEDRPLVIRPRAVDMQAERVPGAAPRWTVDLAFELPRGSYATLLLRRLTAQRARGPVDPWDPRFEQPGLTPRRQGLERERRAHDAREGNDRRGGDRREQGKPYGARRESYGDRREQGERWQGSAGGPRPHQASRSEKYGASRPAHHSATRPGKHGAAHSGEHRSARPGEHRSARPGEHRSTRPDNRGGSRPNHSSGGSRPNHSGARRGGAGDRRSSR